jgi:hypothetical protein
MSTIPNTAEVTQVRLSRRLVVLALIVALAAAALTLTLVLVGSDGSSSGSAKESAGPPAQSLPADAYRQYIGRAGHAVPQVPTRSRSTSPNDGSQHSGAR